MWGNFTSYSCNNGKEMYVEKVWHTCKVTVLLLRHSNAGADHGLCGIGGRLQQSWQRHLHRIRNSCKPDMPDSMVNISDYILFRGNSTVNLVKRVCSDCPIPNCGAKYSLKLSNHLTDVHQLDYSQRRKWLQVTKLQPNVRVVIYKRTREVKHLHQSHKREMMQSFISHQHRGKERHQ